jgi:hypothetical protein
MEALKEGVNSYVSMRFADAYIKMRYAGHDVWAAWSAMPKRAKEYSLMTARAELDMLPFIGRKRRRDQPLMFPRYPGCALTPDWIAAAQIEIALIPHDAAARRLIASRDKGAALMSRGVKAYAIGHLSETLTGGARARAEPAFMAIPKIARLVDPWLNGGHMVC